MNRATRILPPGPLGGVQLAVRARTRVKRKAGEMNKTEAAYALHLSKLILTDEICAFWFEAITLKLGHDTRYTPDFLVQMADGSLECHDTKGWDTEPAAAVKERVSSTMFPLFVFKEIRLVKGVWVQKVIGPKESA